ncbi:radical SAM protein [Listeria fleischmannii subsp. fleischmannii]|uniref:Radical SAM protein n=1 Tax=Listeria fleischmannii subsp. fleischmannii TaxID=1671902 RepID=A0A2X3HEX7_9LIST|nr:radical SAM protein [Listeria fleischmannii subsp. fleischmannii]
MTEVNPFPYSLDNKRYHTWNYCLRKQFGMKIFKVALDGGFDCPNRDGTVARGGCTFVVQLVQAISLAIANLI